MLSVIIPLAPNEIAWRSLVEALGKYPQIDEIILAVGKNSSDFSLPKGLNRNVVKFCGLGTGRAGQMNEAAKVATNEYLWFLHADTKLDENSVRALLQCLNSNTDALWYFDLAFLADGPRAMPVNAWGVWIRSHIFKNPFGDQGFCLSKKVFMKLGMYPENAPYGEDHLLVWQALQNGIPVCATGAKIFTSARKYAGNGWLKTTGLHLWLWIKQATPEFLKLIRMRLSGKKA